MGEHLLELEQILRSNPGNLTSQEANFLMQCKSNAVKDFTIGGAVGGIITLLGTRGLRNMHRINASIGAAVICGYLRFGSSLDSCAENILSLNGSRMQKELANIIVKKHQADHWTMQLITKHFYLESVFDDTAVDQPKLRWRYRAFFGDQMTDSERTKKSSDNSANSSYNSASDLDGAEAEHTDEPKQAYVRYPAADPSIDPLDYMYGVPRESEEIHHAGTPSGVHQSKRQHGHKRSSRRRHRMRHHQEASAGLEIALQ